MRAIKCVLCAEVVVADIFGEMTDKEVTEKILSHEKRCLQRFEED